MSESRKIDKIKPETLLQLVRVILETSPAFKYISGIQPFLMSFAGKEYYVYVKNVSSAYFEGRDKTTRAQLPIRPEFNEIKASSLPFIFLGYDADNDVLICWNFHIAKRRLNAANSVSFYSRSFFQEEVKPGEFLRKMLKNGDRPVLFKRRDLVEFFNRIDTFFPVDYPQNLPDSSISAKGSFNYKNAFQKYFKISNLSQKTCTNYTQALSGRVSDGISYYLTNEPIDIFFFSDITLLGKWKNQLFKVPEYIELDETGKKMYSCALEKYIQFHRTLDDGTLRLSDLSNDEANNILPFRRYLEQQGKSNETIQSFIEALSGSISRYISDIVNKEVNIFNISDRKQISDWIDQLLQDSKFMQEATTSNKILGSSIYKYFVFLGDQTNQGVNVTGIVESDQTESEEEVDIVKNGKLLRITNPEVLAIIKPLIESNRNLSAAQEVGRYYAEKYPNMTLVDWMNLIKSTAVSSLSYPTNQTLGAPISQDGKKKKLHILKVTFPNGDVVEERVVARTLVKVIEYAGVEKVRQLGIVLNNVNFISDKIVPMYATNQKPVGNGLYVMTCCDTETKHKIIRQISDVLNLDLTVEKISIV